jgi:dihydroflavonol-4-reductase
MQTFVTGGTGLLGNNLVRRLVADGHEVKALVRSPEKAERVLGDLDVEFVVGDVRDVSAFESELAGTEVLFHAAAYFREYYEPGDHREALRRVNVDGTIDLLEAAERRGVARVVYVSSSGVVGRGPDGAPGDETALLAPEETDNLYYRSKIVAEEAVDEFLASSDLSVVRILPGWMFGPWDAAPTAGGRLVLDIARGALPAVFEGGEHVTDVRDVVRAMVTVAEREAPGERYLVAGPYTTLEEIAAAISSLTGVDVPRTVPYPLVALVARLGEYYGRLTGRPVSLTTAATATLRTRRRVDSGRARRELDARFRPLAETLRDEIGWFRDNGYLDGSADATGTVRAGPASTTASR